LKSETCDFIGDELYNYHYYHTKDQ